MVAQSELSNAAAADLWTARQKLEVIESGVTNEPQP
jgi:hypothetical protein